jgi:hypothetical protein
MKMRSPSIHHHEGDGKIAASRSPAKYLFLVFRMDRLEGFDRSEGSLAEIVVEFTSSTGSNHFENTPDFFRGLDDWL